MQKNHSNAFTTNGRLCSISYANYLNNPRSTVKAIIHLFVSTVTCSFQNFMISGQVTFLHSVHTNVYKVDVFRVRVQKFYLWAKPLLFWAKPFSFWARRYVRNSLWAKPAITGLTCVTITPFVSHRATVFNIVFDDLFLFACLFFSYNYRRSLSCFIQSAGKQDI